MSDSFLKSCQILFVSPALENILHEVIHDSIVLFAVSNTLCHPDVGIIILRMPLHFHESDLGSTRETHDVYLILIEALLKIVGNCFSIIKKIIKSNTVCICIVVIGYTHIPVIPIDNGEVFFELHVLVLIGKHIIVRSRTAGHQKKYRIILIFPVYKEAVRSTVNIHDELPGYTVRLFVCPDLAWAHQCPYTEQYQRHSQYT